MGLVIALARGHRVAVIQHIPQYEVLNWLAKMHSLLAPNGVVVLATTYTDGTPGEPVAMFNSMGLLEIAICMGGSGSGYGGATDLLGLKYDDPVRIEFAAAQAAPTLEL